MDKFESIRAFLQVVDQGGFAAAARAMNVSRSAVNKLVINLENDLGTQLLNRTTRRVSPTETGLAFYERCARIMADLEEAEFAVSQLHEEPKGNLRINAPMSFGTRYLARRVARFTAQYPELRVQLTLDDRFVDPIEEGYDLNIRIAEPVESPSLISQVIAPMGYVLCASPVYLERRGTPISPTELRDHSCLHYGYLSTGNQWTFVRNTNEIGDTHDSPEEHTIAIRGALCSNNGEVLCEAAMEGLGIVLLPEFIVCEGIRKGKLQVILSDYVLPSIAVNVLYPVNRHLSAKVKLLIEFLQSQFGPIPPWTIY